MGQDMALCSIRRWLGKALAVLGLFGLAAMADSALAEEPRMAVRLASPLAVTGPDITLGDIFVGTGDWTSVVITPAAAPGQSVALDPQWLRQAARRNGLDWANMRELRRVTVRTVSQTVDRNAILDLIAKELANTHGGRWHVRATIRSTIHAPIDVTLAPEILDITHDVHTTRVQARIGLFAGATPLIVAGRAEPAVDYAVMASPISRGERVSPSHISWATGPASALPQGAVTNPEALIGYAARRNIAMNQPLRAADVEPPVAVRRGQPATLVFHAGRLTLTARARALENAAVGEPARFTNLASGQTIEAWVERPGVAVVGSPYGGHAGLAPNGQSVQPVSTGQMAMTGSGIAPRPSSF